MQISVSYFLPVFPIFSQLLDAYPQFVPRRRLNEIQQPHFFFTSQWEVSHDEGRTVVQWSKDGPSHASHPRTLLVVFVEASGQATGATAVRDYFMFYVEDTNYLDHLLLYWNRVRGVSKLKLWHLQSNLFHLYSEGSWRQVIKTHTHVETEIK